MNFEREKCQYSRLHLDAHHFVKIVVVEVAAIVAEEEMV
jgi:hypothetical protein